MSKHLPPIQGTKSDRARDLARALTFCARVKFSSAFAPTIKLEIGAKTPGKQCPNCWSERVRTVVKYYEPGNGIKAVRLQCQDCGERSPIIKELVGF